MEWKNEYSISKEIQTVTFPMVKCRQEKYITNPIARFYQNKPGQAWFVAIWFD